jgi:hydrogenase expression/formation protein HypD
MIPRSGLALQPAFADLDAAGRFGVADLGGTESPDCRSGDVLQGLLIPI